MIKTCPRLAASLLPLLALAAAPPPVTPMTPDVVASYDPVLPEADYIKRVAMVPMRDGVKLYTVIVMKKGTANAPILLSRTPYDAKGGDQPRAEPARSSTSCRSWTRSSSRTATSSSIRTSAASTIPKAQFVMNRPIAGPLNPTGIDESTDAYDAIDWLVKNVPESNGKVGTIGSSYLGFLTLASEINPHPALKAAVPQSPMVDGWMGDDWFHNGAFRVSGLRLRRRAEHRQGGGRRPRARHRRRLHPLPRGRIDGRLCQAARDRALSVRPEADAESGLHRILVGPGGRQMDGRPSADRADDDRGRAVGPGGQLRRARGLQGAQGPSTRAAACFTWRSGRGGIRAPTITATTSAR